MRCVIHFLRRSLCRELPVLVGACSTAKCLGPCDWDRSRPYEGGVISRLFVCEPNPFPLRFLRPTFSARPSHSRSNSFSSSRCSYSRFSNNWPLTGSRSLMMRWPRSPSRCATSIFSTFLPVSRTALRVRSRPKQSSVSLISAWPKEQFLSLKPSGPRSFSDVAWTILGWPPFRASIVITVDELKETPWPICPLKSRLFVLVSIWLIICPMLFIIFCINANGLLNISTPVLEFSWRRETWRSRLSYRDRCSNAIACGRSTSEKNGSFWKAVRRLIGKAERARELMCYTEVWFCRRFSFYR